MEEREGERGRMNQGREIESKTSFYKTQLRNNGRKQLKHKHKDINMHQKM